MRTLFAVVLAAGIAAAGGCSSGNGNSTPDAAKVTAPVCGDGICAASELKTCPADCGSTVDAAVHDATTGTFMDAPTADGTCPFDLTTASQSTVFETFGCAAGEGATGFALAAAKVACGLAGLSDPDQGVACLTMFPGVMNPGGP